MYVQTRHKMFRVRLLPLQIYMAYCIGYVYTFTCTRVPILHVSMINRLCCHSFSARTVEQYSIWSVGRTPKSALDVRDTRLDTSLRNHKQISRALCCWRMLCTTCLIAYASATGLWNFDNSYVKMWCSCAICLCIAMTKWLVVSSGGEPTISVK